MFAESVAKQIKKKRLPAKGAVDRRRARNLAKNLTRASLGRHLFELAAAAASRRLDPEEALRRHADKVVRRVEKNLGHPGRTAAPRKRRG